MLSSSKVHPHHRSLALFDTSIATLNLGDEIIVDSILSILSNELPYFRVQRIPTHDYLGPVSKRILKQSSLSIVAGTNLLSSRLLRYNQWKFRPSEIFGLKNIVLMGVGWWQYQDPPDLFSRFAYQRILHPHYLHSVRDHYTRNMLASVGIKSICTGCPTMWNLTDNHCSNISQTRSNSVVFTLTDYNRDIEADRQLFNILASEYNNLYFWPQGANDLQYFFSLGLEATILNPSLRSFDHLLGNSSVDYIGTRLHAGIRALQSAQRTIVIAIDNRSIEISRDTHLPIVLRHDLASLPKLINSTWHTKLRIDFNSISSWLSQFC